MAALLRVILNQLAPAAFLESRGGTVVTTAGNSRLDGGFVIVIAGQSSDPVTFNSTNTLAIVTAIGSDWVLTNLPQTQFNFSTMLLISDGVGPWLRSPRCWLIQTATVGEMAILSLDDVRSSMVASGADPGPNLLNYPTQNGDQPAALSKIGHPNHPNVLGYFLLPFENGHIIHLGTLVQGIAVDHAIVTDVLIQNDCSILFPIPKVGGNQTSLLLDSTGADIGAVARTLSNSNLMMAAGPSDGQWSRLKLPTLRIEVKAGLLRVSQFRDQEVWLGHVDDPAAPFLTATSLFTSTKRLSYELELVPAQPKVRFAYADSSIATAAVPIGSERYYGLRVQGLGSRRGVRPALDANQLSFELTTGGARKFHIKAGFSANSFLVPKPDPRSASGSRVLDIPVSGELGLRIAAPATPKGTSLQIDTASGKLTVCSPTLLSAPAGITAQSPDAPSNPDYLRWVLSLPNDRPDLTFTIAQTGINPDLGQLWLNQFHTTDSTVKYGLIEHPGTQLMMDSVQSSQAFRGLVANSKNKTEITTKQASGQEVVAYSAFFAALSWVGARCIGQGNTCLDEKQFKISFPSLDDASFQKFIKQNGLQNLQVVFYSQYAGAHDQIRAFVDGNMLPQGGTPPAKYLWAFAAGLSVLLYDDKYAQNQGDVPAPKYCDEIAALRGASNATVAFDFSGTVSLQSTLAKVYADNPWQKWSSDSPMLWPRLAPPGGRARLDPSDPLWRGVFLRDLPLFLPTPPIVDEYKFLKNLVDSINHKLTLEYGWRDESGPTWSAILNQAFQDGLFTPDSWKSVLQMSLLSLAVKGAAGSVVSAQGTCGIQLGLLTDKSTGKPLEFQATFGLDLESGGNPITRIDFTQDGKPITTDSLPGFSAVSLNRFSTDFKTAQFDLGLTATPELASALPFLSSQTPQRAILAFNLKGDPSLTLSLALPSEVQTNLFGRWPLTVEAISVQFAGSTVELRIRGRLHLGMAEFASVGATVVVRSEAGTVKFNVEIDSISGSLSVGNMTIGGSFTWKDKDNNSGLVDLTGAADAGAKRELWGSVTVTDPGVLGTNALAVRIGNQGEVSFWIATITIGKDIPIGIGRLKKPALLLAHNADFGGNLQKVVADPTGSLLQALRPDFSNEGKITDWLGKWVPSTTIGSILAGSGYVQLQSGIADAPGDDPTKNPVNLSSVLFTDRGLFRIDGVMMVLGAATMRFGLAIDYEQRRITAGLQAPTINLPSDKDPQYQIQAGYITVGVGFGGGPPWLRIGIGWPERIGGTEFERDWTKSTKVYVQSMYPINTFWGGYLAELQTNQVIFGFAIRAGWTWSKQASIGGVASGSADLGITLGGVFQFALSWDGPAGTNPNSPRLLSSPNAYPGLSALKLPGRVDRITSEEFSAHSETIHAAIASFDSSLALLSGVDLAMTAEIFGDVWGKASVQFLGVTLAAISVRAFARFRVCGTLSRGITQAKAEVGFEVSVTILCVTYSAHASIDITLIDGDCPLLDASNRFLMVGESPEMLALSPGVQVPLMS
jgi:hypothetical protein